MMQRICWSAENKEQGILIRFGGINKGEVVEIEGISYKIIFIVKNFIPGFDYWMWVPHLG